MLPGEISLPLAIAECPLWLVPKPPVTNSHVTGAENLGSEEMLALVDAAITYPTL